MATNLVKELLGDEYIGLTQLNDQVWLGAALEAADTELLRQAGITTVINLTCEDYGTDPSFNCFRLNQHDRAPIPPAVLRKFLEWMDQRIDTGDVVLIHCLMGISRTPSFAIAWFMHRNGAGPDKDLRQMWSQYEDLIGGRRPIIEPHWQLKKSVLEYFGHVDVSAFGPIER